MIDTLIISDIHQGYPTSRAEEVRKLLATTPSDRTIVLGDLWTDGNILGTNWGLVDDLRRRDGVIYIAGNHDPFLMSLVPSLLGIPCVWQYEWESFGQKCLAIHGHQYDTVVSGSPELSKALTELFIKAAEKGWVGAGAEHAFDLASMRWSRTEEKIEAGIRGLAEDREAKFVFAGHTHNPKTLTWRDVLKEIYYFNTGCWIGEVMSYVTIEESGTHLQMWKG